MEQYLVHHGVKGMRWGITRANKKPSFLNRFNLGSKSASSKSSSKPTSSPAKPVPKKLSEMNDDELRSKLARFDMEKRYKQYMAEMNPKKTSRARKMMGDLLEKTISTLATKGIEQMVSNIYKKEEAKKEPTVTSLFGKDLFKLSDVEIKAMSDRVENTKKVKSFLADLDKAEASRVEKLMEEGRKYIWADGGGI